MKRSTTSFLSSSFRLLFRLRCLITLFLLLTLNNNCNGQEYYGKLIGRLSELNHGVSGEVYAVDSRTLFIKDFNYDGEGPAAYFYAGNSRAPIINGFRIRDERGISGPLKRYRNKKITLTLPEGKNINNIRWFSVYCDDYSVNFGDVRIPKGFDYPKPQNLAQLDGVHRVSSEPVVVVDAQTILIPSFSYDGEAPDAKFWVGFGSRPSPQGIQIPDENGKLRALRRYDKKTIVLTLPSDLTIHQIGHFGVWCEAFAVDFGHIQIPSNLNVPPSLMMLGILPQSKLNCEVLEDNLAFEVRWAVAGDSIVIQLVAKLDAGQYMSFGLSGDSEHSKMIGGDVVVAWVDKQTLQGYAIDYILDAKSQCSGTRGSCPDNRIQENTNSIRLLNAAMVNGYSIVTYQRSLKASDELDLGIRVNGSQPIIWAIGPLNDRNEVSFHSDYLKSDRFLEFGRPPVWNCPMPDTNDRENVQENVNKKEEPEKELLVSPTTRRPTRPVATPAPAPTKDAWTIPPIECDEPEDGALYAQLGPTGGKHGYSAITGHVGWGIAWYINGLLIPEINVVRGKTYTFFVEGGDNPDVPARYHPFYITDDPIGGYEHKTPEEKAKVKIFAGVERQRGINNPIGVGRFCYWYPDQNQPEADSFSSFGAYQRILSLKCDSGEPGIIQWTPDENTPDTVYYQCYTHRYLGWKINVHDSCDRGRQEASPSENHQVYAQLESSLKYKENEDLESGPSIQVSSKVIPPLDYYHQQHLLQNQQQKHHQPKHQHNQIQQQPQLQIQQQKHQSFNNNYHEKSHYTLPLNFNHNNQQQQQLQQQLKHHHHHHHHHHHQPLVMQSNSYKLPMHLPQSAFIIQKPNQHHYFHQLHHHNNNPNINNINNKVLQESLQHQLQQNHYQNYPNFKLNNIQRHHPASLIRFNTDLNGYHNEEQETASSEIVKIDSPYREEEILQKQQQPPKQQQQQQSQIIPIHTFNPHSNVITDSLNYGGLKYSLPKHYFNHHQPHSHHHNYHQQQLDQQDHLQLQQQQKYIFPHQHNKQITVRNKQILPSSISHFPMENNNNIDKQPKIESKSFINKHELNHKNTGFNPDSIIIEGGFKPIIRNLNKKMINNLDSSSSPSSASFHLYQSIMNNNLNDKYKNNKKFKLDKQEKLMKNDMEMIESHYSYSTASPLSSSSNFKYNNINNNHGQNHIMKTSINNRWFTNNDDSNNNNDKYHSSSDIHRLTHFTKIHDNPSLSNPNNALTTINRQQRSLKRLKRSKQQNNNINNESIQASTGQIVITNIGYIILTVILYFAM